MELTGNSLVNLCPDGVPKNQLRHNVWNHNYPNSVCQFLSRMGFMKKSLWSPESIRGCSCWQRWFRNSERQSGHWEHYWNPSIVYLSLWSRDNSIMMFFTRRTTNWPVWARSSEEKIMLHSPSIRNTLPDHLPPELTNDDRFHDYFIRYFVLSSGDALWCCAIL